MKKTFDIIKIWLHCLVYSILPVFLAVFSFYCQKVFAENGKQPLVLQYQVSHPRNIDQISLIFFEEELHLVVNTSSFQKFHPVRLGIFKLAMNQDLSQIKEEVQTHYERLNQTLSILDYMDIGDTIQIPHTSSAVLLRINSEEVDHFDLGFRPLMNIIDRIWEQPWQCKKCAIYKRKRSSVVRIVEQSDRKKKVEKTYSKKDLDCFSKTRNIWECVDPEFGIFEL